MKNFGREIFEQLGNLFYAVATEQNVSLLAAGELKMLLKKDWLTEKSDPSQDKVSEASHLVGLKIDTLQTEQVAASEAFHEFENFYRKHEEQFSFALKRDIAETATAIINTFPSSGPNRTYDALRRLIPASIHEVPISFVAS